MKIVIDRQLALPGITALRREPGLHPRAAHSAAIFVRGQRRHPFGHRT
ncbi:MAG: hypothetical protein IPM99_27040 [Rubrivivax sp.]|jgi:hypothetical protein|nr:hypothetical protein [Rubrivivax sp.]